MYISHIWTGIRIAQPCNWSSWSPGDRHMAPTVQASAGVIRSVGSWLCTYSGRNTHISIYIYIFTSSAPFKGSMFSLMYEPTRAVSSSPFLCLDTCYRRRRLNFQREHLKLKAGCPLARTRSIYVYCVPTYGRSSPTPDRAEACT